MNPLPRNLEYLLQQNERMLQEIFRNAERADARAAKLTPLLDQIGNSGLLDEQVILGEQVLGLPYAPQEGDHDSQRCYQAVIVIPRGIGVVQMDAEDRYELSHSPEGIEAQASRHFVPLSDCRPVVKHWLLAQIDQLIARMLELMPLKPKPNPQSIITRVNGQTNQLPPR